jgi:hypothetical protein
MGKRLVILWTNSDEILFENMVLMYAKNSLIKKWWDGVTVIIWGSTAKLTANSTIVKAGILELIKTGVNVSACKACADQLGVSDQLLELGIEVKYWGENLTMILQNDQKLITI